MLFAVSDDLSPGGRPKEPRRGTVPAAAMALGLVAGALLFASGVVRCPSAQFLSVSCPACGSTRSIYALFRGDFHGVLFYAPLAPLSVVGILWVSVRAIGLTYRGLPLSRLDHEPGVALALKALLFIVFAQLVIWGLRTVGLCGGPVPLS